MYIGYKLYKVDKTIENYRDMAVWCNSNNAHIEDKGEYYEVVENVEYIPTLEERLKMLEKQYQMNRWQREGILATGSQYSDYAKAKAQELEDIAEQIRNKNNGGQNE